MFTKKDRTPGVKSLASLGGVVRAAIDHDGEEHELASESDAGQWVSDPSSGRRPATGRRTASEAADLRRFIRPDQLASHLASASSGATPGREPVGLARSVDGPASPHPLAVGRPRSACDASSERPRRESRPRGPRGVRTSGVVERAGDGATTRPSPSPCGGSCPVAGVVDPAAIDGWYSSRSRPSAGLADPSVRAVFDGDGAESTGRRRLGSSDGSTGVPGGPANGAGGPGRADRPARPASESGRRRREAGDSSRVAAASIIDFKTDTPGDGSRGRPRGVPRATPTPDGELPGGDRGPVRSRAVPDPRVADSGRRWGRRGSRTGLIRPRGPVRTPESRFGTGPGRGA